MPKKILLADDSITIQKVVELTFSDGDYEVIAVNNGARAIDRLGEMRPDIILSDIIMPEKNGYEVCEFVKSQPALRSIPVILLTGTFEPFDPDRAEKAGCDAVVTKPFESQNLIHKVEELIAAAAEQAAAAAPEVEAPPPPPVDMSGETRAWQLPPVPPSFAQESASPFAAPPSFSTQESPFEMPASEPDVHEQSTDIFEAQPPDAFSGETRAFPAMSFDQMQAMQQQAAPEPPALPDLEEPEPLLPSAPPAFELGGGETRAVPALSYEQAPEPQEPEPPPAPVFEMGEPEPSEAPYSAETRAFPAMSFDQLQAMQQPEPQGEPMFEPPAEEPLAAAPQEEVFGGEAEEPAYSAETRAFPAMSFDQLQSMQQEAAPEPAPEPEWAAPASEEPAWNEPAAAPEPEPEPEPASWTAPAEEPAPAWDAPAEEAVPAPEPEWAAPAAEPEWAAPAAAYDDASTGAIPAMGLDESPLQESVPEPEPEPEPVPEPAAWTEPAEEPAWSAPAEEPAAAWSEPAEEPAAEPAPMLAAAPEPEPEPEPVPEAEPAWSLPAVAAAAPVVAAAASSMGAGELTDAQIDAIARRAVQMMSEDVIRKIAWEVVPELADMIVRDRIKELENAE